MFHHIIIFFTKVWLIFVTTKSFIYFFEGRAPTILGTFHKVWRSPSNSVVVAIQQYGGRHPTIRRSPSNSVAVAIQQCGGCHPTIRRSPSNNTAVAQRGGFSSQRFENYMEKIKLTSQAFPCSFFIVPMSKCRDA